MEQQQRLCLPRAIILDSAPLVHWVREELKLYELMEPIESENIIMQHVSNSIQIASAAQVELEYNCHYVLQDEVPELFYFDTEKRAECLVAFGMELLKLAERTNLFSRHGQLLYEFDKLIGASVVMSRIDVDPCENPANHQWTKGYEQEWTRPRMVAGVHHPRLQVERRRLPGGGSEVFGIRWS